MEITSGDSMGSGINSLAYAGLTDIPAKTVTLQNSGEALKEINEAEAEIKDQIGDQTMYQASQFARLNERGFQSEKEAIKANFEDRIETLKSVHSLERKMDKKFYDVERQLHFFESKTDKNFSEVSHLIKDKFADAERQKLVEENTNLKAELRDNGVVTKILGALRLPTPTGQV